MDVPRPGEIRKELSNMGRVYAIVLVLLAGALLFALLPEAPAPPPDAEPALGVGPPSQ